MPTTSSPESVYRKWLDSLKSTDPELHAELTSRLAERVLHPESVHVPRSGLTLETVAPDMNLQAVALETIVREGRPALLIRKQKIQFQNAGADSSAKVVIERLRKAVPKLEPFLPLVGRIDLGNYPGNLPYAGTGWLVDTNLVVTNRHVADLIASANDGQFVFRPGRFGEDLEVSIDYFREAENTQTSVSKVRRVLWIETDKTKADIAFLEIEPRSMSSGPPRFELADSDAIANSDVAVIGYPARAPAHIIPNQAWMDQIYGSIYDVKRIAPGLVGPPSRGWATHDCTTLGGNSGSVVVEMKSGKAVALHFAGLYLVENYAVPASTIRRYLKDQPWHSGSGRPRPQRGETSETSTPAKPTGTPQQVSVQLPGTAPSGASISVTVPLTITLSLGLPLAGTSASADGSSDPTSGIARTPATIREAAQQLWRDHRTEGVYSTWAGFRVKNGRLSDDPCVIVSAHPERLEEIRSKIPQKFGQFPVEVWPAPLEEQLGLAVEEAATSISYNDDDRTGKPFSFSPIEERMTVKLHVGPERSWTELKDFLKGSQSATEIVSSIYQFHAKHIADAIEQQLKNKPAMTLVTAQQSRNPRSSTIRQGDFDRSQRFENWRDKFAIEHIYVPLGQLGLVANSYHIKVTVRDQSQVWLSSGNWTRSSQPEIPKNQLDDPKKTNAAGNREWHVIIDNPTLAARFQNHILADYEQSLELGGTLEVPEEEQLVDIPKILLESFQLEAAPEHVVEPKTITKKIKVQPLLTPDKKGKVYCDAVLKLIRSAKRQLLFQNQYIKMRGASSGLLKELVDALAEKAKTLNDCRIILRSASREELHFDLTRLKQRGVDVQNQVRILASTHTKGLIVDGKRVLVGSHNWSSLGVSLNRDASLIFEDPDVAAYFQEVFELDWQRASEPRLDETIPEGVRPALGGAPPPGFVRMRLSDYLEGERE